MDLIQTLENLLSSDQMTRTTSEQLISNLAEADFKEYLSNMCTILSNEGVSLKARKVSTTLIKNPIAYLTNYSEKWKGFDKEFKDNIKQMILATLGSETAEIRKGGASIIATIIKAELPLSEKWPTLLSILCQSKFEQKVFNLAAIETLGYICEELTKKEVTSNEVDQILSAIVLCMKNNISDYDLSLVSIKSLIKTIPLIGIQKMSIVEYSNILMNEIFSLGNTYQTDETVLEHILRIFIEIIENYYDVFEPYHDKMASFVFLMIESQSERLRIMGFEFWCRLGSEELERSKNRRKNYACKFYFQAYFEKLKLIIEKFILPKKADEEEDEWNTSKASCYLLVVLVQVINAESFETIVAGIKETIKSDNHNVIKKSIIILTCSMESIHKTISFQLALQYLYKIAKSLAGTSMDLKLICARALVTITKVIGKYMEPSNLKTLIPLLKDSLFINNKLGISVCTALNNIIVSHGDLNTNRSQNNVSPYFEELIGALAYCDQNLELFDKDNNLAIYCFITMENLIAYSSHDKQNKLMEILANYVMKLNSLQDDNISINGNIKSDLESHYTRLIRFIIVKLFVPLKIPDAQHIYNIIVKTFLKRNIYDEGLLAISSFAISKCYIYIFI